ncbi:FAD/NAD(P)-binding oxidoreductase [Micromonospora polyrhachis]|uniref:NADPH-dependent 2,4-dienoyl-CoA reductase/sulfur reductase-like enzyme n=1 Tax=Micromonospora polyrhachis TaxID=1282883 RepID=A0A7W7ST62_9ACTN|nr:FAD-dependent oxidoreductase [Micromonospora polyrhachis]MBB4960474.1 NADPH-dependent 2,4-dienoyl-CoA reductase/sulfur reductase-like enzyme [Micromonospora polyrhachis]
MTGRSASPPRHIVVIGAGPAGFRAAQELRALGYDGELTMVGDEPHRPYRRPPLSKELLVGPVDVLLPGTETLDARWLLGQPATGLDLRHRRVLRGQLPAVPFDTAVVATGVRARRPAAIPALAGIHTLRSLDDALALRAELSHRPTVVVAGAGFVGSEIAATLRGLGLAVTLVGREPVPLHRALGVRLGRMVARTHREHGVDLRLGRTVVGVSGAGRVEQVRLDDGTALPADLLVLALGAEPNTEWLRGSGLRIDDGVVCGPDGLAAPGVAVAGDVARWPHPLLVGELVRVEHHSNAVDQGTFAARALLDPARHRRFASVPSFWTHLYDRRVQSVGFTGAAYDLRIVEGEPEGRFLAEYRRHGRLIGAVTVGLVRRLAACRHQLSEEIES